MIWDLKICDCVCIVFKILHFDLLLDIKNSEFIKLFNQIFELKSSIY